jgi:hypothetical protein
VGSNQDGEHEYYDMPEEDALDVLSHLVKVIYEGG